MRGHVITLGIALAIGLGWMFVWLYGAGALPWLKSWYDVRAVTLSAGSLGTGASVTIAGIKVGHISSIRRSGDGAIIGLAIEKRFGPISRDSHFGVRLRTVVGENYVAIYPGKSTSMLPSGGLLGPSQAVENVDIDQILNTLQGGTRAQARQMIQGLGSSLDGRGQQLNGLLSQAAGTVEASAPVTQVLAQDHRQVTRLTDELGQLTAAIGQRGASLRELASAALITFESISKRAQALGATLDRLPATLAQVRSTTAILRSVTVTAAPVLSDLAAAVQELSPAIHNLLPAAREGTTVVNALGDVAPRLQSTLGRLRRLSGPATRALPALNGTLCQLNPAAQYLSPYSKEFASLLQDMGSAANFYDPNGHAARLFVTVGENTLKFESPQAAAAIHSLLNTGILGLNENLGYNPLPAPGNAGETASSGAAPGVTDVKSYPRIQASC
jgi:phospholipid/cholesterol/gamma-HCH transport system substrate-binding protein